jgi:molybdopterin-guanine dinucleotide biosynthesis protein A
MESNQLKSALLRVEGVTGVILAGGKSTRYGANKAFAEVRGVRLIERTIRVMDSVFQRLLLVTNTPDEYAYLNLPMVEDLIKGLGPLGGIYTGLEVIGDGAGFFVACDMPFLRENFLRYMVTLRGDHDAVVPRVKWMVEPLHALYAKKCLPAITESVHSREKQILKFFQKIKVRYVEEEEIRSMDPDLKSFFNINRPEDLERINGYAF